MQQRVMGLVIASMLILAPTAPAMAQAEPSTTTVEIPGAGAVVTLPREWRTWQRNEPDRVTREATGVWTTELASGWTCHLRSDTDLVSAETAADEMVAALEYVPYRLRERATHDAPEGRVVSVTYESTDQDPPRIFHDVYVDAPEGVVLVYCGEAPIEHWLDVARAIAPLPADFSPEPFDPSVQMADHGLAVDFGAEWRLSSRTDHLTTSLLGGPTVLSAQWRGGRRDSQTCTIEDDTDMPGLPRIGSVAAWRAALVYAAQETGGSRFKTDVVDLPSGPAIRADWKRLWGTAPATAWVVTADDRVLVLVCLSNRPPKDRWLSIAETLEVLSGQR